MPCLVSYREGSMPNNSKAIEYAQEQVELWAANTYDVYLKIVQWNGWDWTDGQIAEQLRGMIERREHESDWLTSEDGEQQAAFGDADGVTLSDIDWSAVIRSTLPD